MPLYQYQALDLKGKRQKGLIEAQNERDAKEKLREQGVMVSNLQPKTAVSSRQNLKGENLLTFTMQLAQLLSAGIPLYESLIALEEQYRQESFHRIILSLSELVKAGTPLSAAMANYPDSFDKLYCSMISAGEAVGALDKVLEKLQHLIAKQQKLKKQMTNALIYPAILGTFSLLIIALLLGFVVPSIEGIFADRELNTFTEVVLSFSHFFRNYWWIYLPCLVGLGVFSYLKLKTPQAKKWIEKKLLHVPLVKTLLIQAAMARFCRTMATLQLGGMTMIDSLRASRGVLHNAVIEEVIKNAEVKIIEGSSLSAELGKSPLIPQLVSRMLAVGEDSGTTLTMLNKIADIYEDEVEKSLDRVMSLAQPVILIFMGTLIGLVLMAVLLPLTDIGSITSM